jgi:hypothetical protein
VGSEASGDIQQWDPVRPHPYRLTRRELLARASACGWLVARGLDTRLAGQTSLRLPLVPRINGGINVHPLRRLEGPFDLPVIIPELVDLQLRAVYELGIQQIRTTVAFDAFGFGSSFLGAIPYVRAARALGIDVVAIIGNLDAGPNLPRALANPELRLTLLRVYVDILNRQPLPVQGVDRIGTLAMQVLNEPTHFSAIPPRLYVQRFLRPVYSDLKFLAPELTVVSAAPVGTRNGVLRAREMFRAGLERYCDRVAFHVYEREATRYLAGLSSLPVWITESSTAGPERHLDWVTRVYDEIYETLGNVERIFYYDLFDFISGQFRLFGLTADEVGGVDLFPESTRLLDYFAARVDQAMQGRKHKPYEALIPDITAYFPTAEDHLIIGAADLGKGLR